MFVIGVVEDAIVLYGVLFREKGVIVFFGVIKFEDEVLAPFGAVLDSCYFSHVDGISLAFVPPVLRNHHVEAH